MGRKRKKLFKVFKIFDLFEDFFGILVGIALLVLVLGGGLLLFGALPAWIAGLFSGISLLEIGIGIGGLVILAIIIGALLD